MLITSYSIFTFLLILLNYTILSQLPKDTCCILELKIISAVPVVHSKKVLFAHICHLSLSVMLRARGFHDFTADVP